MTASVTHFEIYAEEPPKLAQFYKALFGWSIVKAIDVDYFHIHMAPSDGTAVKGGVMLRPIASPKSWVSYVCVDSIDETLERVRQLGGRVVDHKSAVPKAAWYAVVEDPEGNIFAVYQLDPAAVLTS
jgi:hypothetical protein